ncbi:MAG: tRNA lysidine(34) synthetase TilS [Magnetococcus sp. YQC-3]
MPVGCVWPGLQRLACPTRLPIALRDDCDTVAPSSPLLVRRFLQQAAPLFPGSCRVVVAVSGGADSLALLHLLLAGAVLPQTAVQVAHFDHGLRPDSAEDARFVQAEAARLGLSCQVGEWTEVAKRVGGDLAERAREARYQFLLACAQAWGATRVVTGHHRDDQAETFLERLLRGSGVHGLSAIPASRPLAEGIFLVRPLLAFSRAELREWLTASGLTWREDASNRLLTARRNRIRHLALPALQSVADSGLTLRLAATAERMAQADATLGWMFARLWPEWDPQETMGGLSLSAEALQDLPEEMLCRCLQRCHRQLHGQARPPGSRAVAGFVRLLRSRRRRWQMVVQGLTIQRQQGRILFLPLPGISAKRLGQEELKQQKRSRRAPNIDSPQGNH